MSDIKGQIFIVARCHPSSLSCAHYDRYSETGLCRAKWTQIRGFETGEHCVSGTFVFKDFKVNLVSVEALFETWLVTWELLHNMKTVVHKLTRPGIHYALLAFGGFQGHGVIVGLFGTRLQKSATFSLDI